MAKNEILAGFQASLKKAKLGAFAVMDLPSVNLLTAFPFAGQGDAYLLITPAKAFCFTKPMYAADVKVKAPYLTLVDSLDVKDIAAKAAALKIKKAVFDPLKIMYIAGNFLNTAGFAQAPNFLNEFKEVKTAAEISKIKKACQISKKAFDELQKHIKTGVSEKQLAQKLEDIMTKLGGQNLAFTTIIAFGENTANPHHSTGDRKLKNNEPVLMDYGCRYGGYCSDITRTIWHGPKPSKEFSDTFKIVKTAHDKAIKQAAVGLSAKQLDAVCRDYFASFKLADFFIHGTGHSLGLEIHETPFISRLSADVLRADNVFTIEPGLYFEGKFGIRYEDTVHLTKKGAVILTK